MIYIQSSRERENTNIETNEKKLIQSTIKYSIQHDKKGLLEVVNEFRKDVEDILNTVLELEELMDV